MVPVALCEMSGLGASSTVWDIRSWCQRLCGISGHGASGSVTDMGSWCQWAGLPLTALWRHHECAVTHVGTRPDMTVDFANE